MASAMILFPLAFAAVGLIPAFGIFRSLAEETSDKSHRELNMQPGFQPNTA